MEKVGTLWAREPAVLIGALRAVLVAAVGFGLSLSADQIVLIILAFESILTALTRAAVYSPATVTQMSADSAAKVLEAAGGLVVTDAPLVTAESLNPVAAPLAAAVGETLQPQAPDPGADIKPEGTP